MGSQVLVIIKKQVKTSCMRVLFITVLLATGLCSCNSEPSVLEIKGSDDSGSPEIKFTQLVHDFGKIEEGEKVACVFIFKNSGNKDLLISSATTSCGCTVPEFDDKPIPPGGDGKVEVVFDSVYRHGAQNKTITIMSNASKPMVILRIKAEVITKN